LTTIQFGTVALDEFAVSKSNVNTMIAK